MENYQNIPSWLAWIWSIGTGLGVVLAILAIFREFPLIKRVSLVVFSPIRRILAMFSQWWYEVRYSPKIKIERGPDNIVIEPIKNTNSFHYLSSIIISLEPRDKEEKTKIDIEKIVVTITQGRGRRQRVVGLDRDREKDGRTILVLAPNDEPRNEEISFIGIGNTENPRVNVNLNNPFRWRIVGIQVYLWGLHKKVKFSGKKK